MNIRICILKKKKRVKKEQERILRGVSGLKIAFASRWNEKISSRTIQEITSLGMFVFIFLQKLVLVSKIAPDSQC